MTVREFYESCHCESKLKVLSAFNGKVLCYSYEPQKHTKIGEREMLDIWAEVQVSNSTFGNYAVPILCCFASGTIEAEEHFRKE